MGKKYYYFAASLPLLDFYTKPSLTVEGFLSDSRRLLDSQDSEVVARLMEGKSVDTVNSVIKEYLNFDKSLRNQAVFYRAEKLKLDPSPFVRGDHFEDPAMVDILQRADAAVDPLEAERILAKFRWDFLAELGTGQFYNFESILIYGLQLQILERNRGIQSPQGKEQYEKIKEIDFAEEFQLTEV